MATRLFDVLFRWFLGAPDQDYRGVPTKKDDELFDKAMTIMMVLAVIGTVALEVLK